MIADIFTAQKSLQLPTAMEMSVTTSVCSSTVLQLLPKFSWKS